MVSESETIQAYGFLQNSLLRYERSNLAVLQPASSLSDELSASHGRMDTSTAHGLNYMPAMLIRSFIERLAGMVDGVGHMGHHAHVRVTRLCESKQ